MPMRETLSEAPDACIAAFHAIDEEGVSFRYTSDLGGEQTLARLPASAELTHMLETVAGLLNYLEACFDSLTHARDAEAEMRSYYTES